jgi:hypothetical protein
MIELNLPDAGVPINKPCAPHAEIQIRLSFRKIQSKVPKLHRSLLPRKGGVIHERGPGMTVVSGTAVHVVQNVSSSPTLCIT